MTSLLLIVGAWVLVAAMVALVLARIIRAADEWHADPSLTAAPEIDREWPEVSAFMAAQAEPERHRSAAPST